jgi:hypothetical protein
MNQPLPQEWVERIFLRLHGRFGSAFTDKYKLNQYDADGNDLGVLNAKYVWAEELAGISADRIKAALLYGYEYPPSCDQFKAQCKSTIVAHQDYKALPKPKLSDEQVNEIHNKLAKFTSPKRDYKAWAKKILDNPSQYPDISVRFAKEALEIKDDD